MNKKNLKNLRVAIVHDFFQEYGGAERVAEVLHDLFPDSHVYTAAIDKKRMKIHWYRFKNWYFHVSLFGRLPFLKHWVSPFRFLAPMIWESLDLSNYDLVLSSSGWFMCKGVITRPETLHISYVHHQNKFLTYYETPDDWKRNFFKRLYGYIVGTPLRMWDFIGSQRPDILVANSQETRRRINKYYRRDAEVIYPPVRDPEIKLKEKWKVTEDYYINVNRLSPPKHVEVLVEAANKTGVTLYVVGGGSQLEHLKKLAKKNVIFTGEVSDIELSRLYMGAKGFLFASQDEEFGIAPVEAMMYGIPVIALKSGGLKETVKDGVNGYLVENLDASEFATAIRRMEKEKDFPKMSLNAFNEAKKYTTQAFTTNILQLIAKHI